MTDSRIHAISAPFKAILPHWAWSPLRSLATASITPIWFSYSLGHFRSCFSNRAVTSGGKPLPWYSYPAIHLLKERDFSGKRVLEFGGGSSTLWWAEKAQSVVTLEENEDWCAWLRSVAPENAEVILSPVLREGDGSYESLRGFLAEKLGSGFDVIVVDGNNRFLATKLALELLRPSGVLILDDAHGYGYMDLVKNTNLTKVDYYGFAPAVSQTKCTSFLFDGTCFLFDARWRVVPHVY